MTDDRLHRGPAVVRVSLGTLLRVTRALTQAGGASPALILEVEHLIEVARWNGRAL